MLEQRQILPQPLVWQRRQTPPQQATTRPALMEGVERTNAVMVRGLGQRIGGTLMQWRWIEEGIAMLAGDLGI